MIENAKKSVCVKCEKEFLIIKEEDAFYKKKGLPMPVNCPECRRNVRADLRNGRKLFDRKCDKCEVIMNTTYLPEYAGKVYCEKCYLNEIY